MELVGIDCNRNNSVFPQKKRIEIYGIIPIGIHIPKGPITRAQIHNCEVKHADESYSAENFRNMRSSNSKISFPGMRDPWCYQILARNKFRGRFWPIKMHYQGPCEPRLWPLPYNKGNIERHRNLLFRFACFPLRSFLPARRRKERWRQRWSLRGSRGGSGDRKNRNRDAACDSSRGDRRTKNAPEARSIATRRFPHRVFLRLVTPFAISGVTDA